MEGKCPGCGRVFKKVVTNQVYCNRGGMKRCKNKMAAQRMRDRAKRYGEMMAEQHGAMGTAAGATAD